MDTLFQNPPKANRNGFQRSAKKQRLPQLSVLTLFSVLFLQSCFETQSGQDQKIAPTPTPVIAMAISSDIPQDPVPELDCVFNGASVVNGDSVTAFQNSSVDYGQACLSETRICRDAILSGSFSYSTCAVATPKSCLFDGQTVEHGNSVTGYTSSTVGFGSSCTEVAQIRTCDNGALSGNAQYGLCRVDEPRSCLFDGRTMLHGETVQAFATSTTQFGGQCISETRTCNDGTLSGTNAYSSCSIDQPASCLFDGLTVSHGSTVVAYASASAVFGQTCTAETRVCSNGQLSGSFTNGACVVNEPANCLFNGNTVAHGESVIAYNIAVANSEISCQSEVRSCQNGTLSGIYNETSCVTPPPVPVDPPVDPVPPTNPPVDPVPEKGCLINGKEIPSGSSITLFTSSQVTAPATCVSEVRECKNGVLSGSATAATCVQVIPPVEPPTLPPVVDPVPPTIPPVTPPGQCSLDGMIWELPNECNSCGSAIGFQKSRISRDGGKTWVTIKTHQLPDDLAAVWTYMTKKFGQNRCGRPNVNYSVSPRSRSLLVMDPKAIPGCDLCKFREYEVQYLSGNTCAYKKKRQTHTVIKYTCEVPKPQPPKCEHKYCDHKKCDHLKRCDKKSCEIKHCDKKSCDHKSCDRKHDDHKSCRHKECDKKKSVRQKNDKYDDKWHSSWKW